ncbi:hypothetical protein [Streptomyces sp. NPDC001601]|uniref:hypothetical protein n=1 Tax=unclassified Streptomyces TaxID=2593676 RepID=UPI0036A5B420
MPAVPLAGKTVIDTCNYGPERDGHIPELDSYSVVDAGTPADSWRQATGTPVWGTPYGSYSNEKGQPVGEDAIHTALATATR